MEQIPVELDNHIWTRDGIRRLTKEERKNLLKWRKNYRRRMRIAERDVYGEDQH